MKHVAQPNRRDSGHTSIGSIPANWEVVPVQYCCDMLVGYAFPSDDFLHEPSGTPLLRGDNITTGRLRWGDRSRYWDHEDGAYSRYLLNDGDIVIGMDGSRVGHNYALVRSTDLPLLLVQRVARLRAKPHVKASFLYYCIANERFHAHVDVVRTDPAIPHITAKDIAHFKICVPPVEEQALIVMFLDHKTAEIDALIAKKQRMIDLLQEKRQALVSEVVTKGLEPSVPMKDSGIEWLGRIPAHWKIKRLKHISPKQGVGLVINPSTYVVNDGVPFLFGGDISEGHIDTTKCRRMTPEDSRRLAPSMLRTGDLVTVRVGYPGVTAVVPPELDGSNCASVMIVRCSPSFVSEWLCYVLNSPLGKEQIDIVKYGAAQEQFNIGHAVEFRFPVPPREKQRAIVKHLDLHTKRLQGAVGVLERQIDKLREYRQTLISAAVTGKIDMCKEVA